MPNKHKYVTQLNTANPSPTSSVTLTMSNNQSNKFESNNGNKVTSINRRSPKKKDGCRDLNKLSGKRLNKFFSKKTHTY